MSLIQPQMVSELGKHAKTNELPAKRLRESGERGFANLAYQTRERTESVP